MSGEAWYLLDAAPVTGPLRLAGDEGRHAAGVRRTRVGERLVVTDGRGTVGGATVTAVERAALDLVVDEVRHVPRPEPAVTVVQALPKGERAELAVDLLTEAGVDAIVPWQASRCIVRWDAAKAARNVERWRAVARSAAKQSRRPWVPEVAAAATTADVLARIRAADAALVLHEAVGPGDGALVDAALPAAGELLLVVGPEGGVSPEELAAFREAGARAVRLGPQVLRTSSAGAVALGALGVLTDRWR